MTPQPGGEPTNASNTPDVESAPKDLIKEFFTQYPPYEDPNIKRSFLNGEITQVSVHEQRDDEDFWIKMLENARDGKIDNFHATEGHPKTFPFACNLLIGMLKSNPNAVIEENSAINNFRDKSALFSEHRYVITTAEEQERTVTRPAYLEYGLELVKCLKTQENFEKQTRRHLAKLATISEGFALMTAATIAEASVFYGVNFDAISALDSILPKTFRKNNPEDVVGFNNLVYKLSQGRYNSDIQQEAETMLNKYFRQTIPQTEDMNVRIKFKPRVVIEGSERLYRMMNAEEGQRVTKNTAEIIPNRIVSELVTGFCDDELPNMNLAKHMGTNEWGITKYLNSHAKVNSA